MLLYPINRTVNALLSIIVIVTVKAKQFIKCYSYATYGKIHYKLLYNLIKPI